jgi:hypothetical protein
MSDKPLGRRQPPDLEHVARYPLSALVADPAHELVIPPAGTEKSLGLPWWWKQHDQGVEGSCVGFGCSAMMSITNHYQRLLATGRDLTYRYEARWLYGEAQHVDEWDDTPPGEGTSVRAGCQILHERGHRRVQNGAAGPENLAHGISAYRWATGSDELRAAIFGGLAVAIGVNWYSGFDNPKIIDGERWLPATNIGSIRGGHSVCLYRMSDRRQAFMLMNSWGYDEGRWPAWVPYSLMERLIDEFGEAVVVTDR